MRAPLNVNPDGAAASYTPGDHGYTYIANGLSLLHNGRSIACRGANSVRCRALFIAAERMAFGRGSALFCVFAMEVEPIAPGTATEPCSGDSSRRLIGDGRGRPRMGPEVPAVGGGTSQTYLSMTSMRQIVGGRAVYLDSATVPVLVRRRDGPLGAVAWLRYGARSAFAILGDTGPAYGEGSIALHQLLRYGALRPPQPVGPIAASDRCGPSEQSIRPPFSSMPDRGDHCRPGRPATQPTDIRGYANIEEPVDIVILRNVAPARRGSTVQAEVTTELLARVAQDAGYTPACLALIADRGRR